MVEAGANEATEAEILDALDIAHEEIKKLCAAQRELAAAGGQREDGDRGLRPSTPPFTSRSRPRTARALDAATQIEDKLERQDARPRRSRRRYRAVRRPRRVRKPLCPSAKPLSSSPSTSSRRTSSGAGSLSTRRRPDGRAADEIREVTCEVGIAPRTHGSALFTRGQTQAFTVSTLGTSREEQRLDTLGLETSKRYIHHYNFPPFSVGEAGFMRGPKRRDIGHGALAERALLPMIPPVEDFPYTIRIVSDTSSRTGLPRWHRSAARRSR